MFDRRKVLAMLVYLTTSLGTSPDIWWSRHLCNMRVKRQPRELARNHHNQLDEKFVVHWTGKIHETLGKAAFSAAMAEGGRLSFEEAVMETRKWLGDMQE